jgi:hypothetical protein
MDAPPSLPSLRSLHFHGPFTFIDRGRGIATCEFAHSKGVYLWILTDGLSRYVHYVGHTVGFLGRHKGHLTSILSLYYGLFRADAVAANDPDRIFGGMWRLWKTNPGEDPLTITATKWKELQQKIMPYLESIELFFAPTPALSNNERCHVEGCIARNLHDKHPNEARFYPSDNLTGRSRDKATGKTKLWGIPVPVTSDHPIMGIDPSLEL